MYNELNLLVEVIDPIGNSETYQYDLNGNQTHATNALGKTTISTYDTFNRLKTVTDPEGNSIINTYDLLGRLVSVTDARGHETTYEYDALGRLIGVTDAESGTVAAAYDVLGNRTSVTDPRSKAATFEYDTLNRLTSATDPLGNAVVRAYDEVGNLMSLTNADGTSTFEYDHLYRVTEVTQPDLTTIVYTYDDVGNRLSVTDTAGVTAFVYDDGDRVTRVTDPFGNTVGYTYDPNGNRSSIQYPGYKSVFYLFDELDRVSQVQDWGGVTTTYTYDTGGRLSTQTMGNNVVVTYSYDDSGRLVGKEDRTGGGALIAGYTYTLDPNGNRTGMGLAQPLMPDVDAIDQTMGHNDGNQVTTNSSLTYTYNDKGNRISKTDGVATTTFEYDFNNRLTNVNDGTNLWEYLYTSSGHRISSTENGVEKRYLLDLNAAMEMVLAEMDTANAVEWYYVYGDGLLYSVDGATGDRLYYHYDPVGSTVALTDFAAVVKDSYSYLPYGELTGVTGGHENPFGFVGKLGVIRENNGLYFMRARYFDPESRSFISVDPVKGSIIQGQTLNNYSYATGNPESLVDPQGTFSKTLETGFSLAAGIPALGVNLYNFIKTPNSNTGLAMVQSAIPVATDAFSLTAGSGNPLISLGFEAFEFGKGFAAGVSYDEWEKTMSGGNVVGYTIGVLSRRFVEWLGDGDGMTGITGVVHSNTLNAPPSQATGAAMSVTASDDSSAEGGSGSGAFTPDPGKIRVSNGKKIYPSPEFIAYKNKLRWFGGDPAALARWAARKSKPPGPPTKYLDVAGYAKGKFNEQYRHILAPNFLDQQTLSYVEFNISSAIATLSQKKYRYKQGDSDGKRRAKEKRARDVSNSIGSLYTQLISALSKHHVMIRDLSAMPSGATGGIARTGVYAGGGS